MQIPTELGVFSGVRWIQKYEHSEKCEVHVLKRKKYLVLLIYQLKLNMAAKTLTELYAGLKGISTQMQNNENIQLN